MTISEVHFVKIFQLNIKDECRDGACVQLFHNQDSVFPLYVYVSL